MVQTDDQRDAADKRLIAGHCLFCTTESFENIVMQLPIDKGTKGWIQSYMI